MSGCGRKNSRCGRCDRALDFVFTMAFQPLVDVRAAQVIGYESLVRGVNGESAGAILARVDQDNLYQFDQACRIRALELAHRLDMSGVLSINFLPNAVYEPEACIQATLKKADEIGWPAERLAFEIVETEYVRDRAHLQNIVSAYHAMGFRTAIDDFGSGYANLDLLVDLMPTYLKIDRGLIAGVHRHERRAAAVESIVALARRLSIGVVAEGVETLDEARWLYAQGVDMHQGFLYARPAIEQLPDCDPDLLDRVRQPATLGV